MTMNKVSILRVIIMCVGIGSCFIFNECAGPGGRVPPEKPDFAGIWIMARANEEIPSSITKENYPFLKGVLRRIKWAELEPTKGDFQWEIIDNHIRDAINRNVYAMLMIIIAPDPPQWLFDAGVPEIQTDFRGGSSFPYYLNETFKTEFKRMISAVATYVQAYQGDMRTKLIAIQAPVGASGDPHPYKAGPGGGARDAGATWCVVGYEDYCISEQEWSDYQKEMFQYFSEQYQNSNPKIFVLFNPSEDLELQNWMLNNLPLFWIKFGPIADRYQINEETEKWGKRWLRELQHLPSRGEMDTTDEGWFQEYPIGNIYWSHLWALHNGLDMHNQLLEDLENPQFHFSFEFFVKYAGYTFPEQSHGAWIALRDGLDAADTNRFPEDDVYGPLEDGKNKERYLNIAEAFSDFGAKQSDPNAGKKTSWDALNDVGYKIHPGNYQMWIRQIEPETSQGYWRQGPEDQGYGRFARGFGQINKMYFDIDDRFFLNKPLAGAYPIKIRIVYLDAGIGKWALDYDGLSGGKTIEVQKQNSGEWKEFTIEIIDGNFSNGLEKGADLILRNADSEQDIFHMIEITR